MLLGTLFEHALNFSEALRVFKVFPLVFNTDIFCPDLQFLVHVLSHAQLSLLLGKHSERLFVLALCRFMLLFERCELLQFAIQFVIYALH